MTRTRKRVWNPLWQRYMQCLHATREPLGRIKTTLHLPHKREWRRLAVLSKRIDDLWHRMHG